MKKLGAWLINTSHAIARWFGKVKRNCMCWWNKILYAITFTMKDCSNPQSICTCKK
tara:strand:+ start:1851 stop:2018 length:168 start_codon:yes stop_codon:yes gene_type:complete